MRGAAGGRAVGWLAGGGGVAAQADGRSVETAEAAGGLAALAVSVA
jgi:hypothetical protein